MTISDFKAQAMTSKHQSTRELGTGITHRALTPDNIWPDPKQRGGCTGKVLDFGIAKLEEQEDPLATPEVPVEFHSSVPTYVSDAATTFAGDGDGTMADGHSNTK